MSNNIYKDVIAKYGPIAQTLQVAEELVELSKELIKASKIRVIIGPNTQEGFGEELEEKVAEEWADVEIVLNYLPILFKNTHIGNWKNDIKENKLKILADKLKIEDDVRDGLYFGEDEASARRSGCTAYRCETCGATISKYHALCPSCINQRKIKKYNAMPEKEWDGVAMLYSDALDVWFGDIDEAREDAELNKKIREYTKANCASELLPFELKDLRLIIGERVNFFTLDPSEIYADILPDNHDDVPKEIEAAFYEMNKKIREYTKANCASWEVGIYRLKLNGVEI